MDFDTCCFVAPALIDIPGVPKAEDTFCSKLIIKIVLEIEGQIKNGCHHFLTGLTSEAELWFAEAVLDIKRVHAEDDLHLHIVLPPNITGSKLVQEYASLTERILKQADTLITLPPEPDTNDDQLHMQYFLKQAKHMIIIIEGNDAPINALIECACNRGLPVSIIRFNRRKRDDIVVRNLTIVR